MICGKGIAVPRDLAHGETDSKGADGFVRYASKLATGTGKTTVMAMLSAWSILNKVQKDKSMGQNSSGAEVSEDWAAADASVDMEKLD